MPQLLSSLLFILAFLPVQVCAGELTLLEVAGRLQSTYEQTMTLTATFQQSTSSQMSQRKKQGRGTLVLAKPGLMRWDYQEPDVQVFVCDGKNIGMYFAKEKQMILTDATHYLESDVTYSFFSGTGNILKDFEVMAPEEEAVEESLDLYHIKIIPRKGHPQVDYIHIWVDQETFLLRRIRVTDKFGSETDIVFADIKRNAEVDKMLFTFTPPAGTEIVQQ